MRGGERLIRLADVAEILCCSGREAKRTLAEWGVLPSRIGYGRTCTAWRLADVEDVVVRMSLAAREAAAAAAKRRVRAKGFTMPRNFEEFAAAFGPVRTPAQ